MTDPNVMHVLRERLSRRWPALMRALPQQIRFVREGGNIGLSDRAVIIRRDWLKTADLPELQRALLHLAAHAALGHRPWRVRLTNLHRHLDQEASHVLRVLGVTAELSGWQDDHHGQWREAPTSEPGLDQQGRSRQNKPSTLPRTRLALNEPDANDALAEPEQTAERTEHAEQAERSPNMDRPGEGVGSRAPVASARHQQGPTMDKDWRRLLQIWLTRRAWRNWRFDRPPRHNPAPFILPRLSGRDLNLAIALDISGSISDHWLQGFLAEIEHLRALIPMRLRLITCDNRIHEDRRDVHHPTAPLISGGGGTDFRPVFARLHGDGSLDALIYCTDLVGEFPKRPPAFPVFWLTPQTDRAAPFGSQLMIDLA